jgi:hypothetical protein
MPMSDYLANALLNHVLKYQAFTPPTVLYVDMLDPPTDPNYKRQRITFTEATANQSANPVVFPTSENEHEVRFPIARNSWGEKNFFHIYDAITGGNQLFYDMPASVNIAAGEQLVVPAGGFQVSFDSPQASKYLLLKLLNMVLRGESFSMSSLNIVMALCTATPNWYDTSVTEISGGGGYSSVVGNSWGPADGASIHNSASIDFGPVTDPDVGWDDIGGFALLDSQGNILLFGDANPQASPLQEEDVLVTAQ